MAMSDKPEDERQDARRAQWRESLEDAWPHLREALWRRLLAGDPLEELAGVVVEHQGEVEPYMTVGVLRRAELADTLKEGGYPSAHWAEWLRRPAPEGCVPVFGALHGHSEVCILGPLRASQSMSH